MRDFDTMACRGSAILVALCVVVSFVYMTNVDARSTSTPSTDVATEMAVNDQSSKSTPRKADTEDKTPAKSKAKAKETVKKSDKASTAKPEPIVQDVQEKSIESDDDIIDLGYSIAAYGSKSAHDGGALVLWQPGYYLAHEWSEAGVKMLSLSVGDTFRVDGQEHRVEGVHEFPEMEDYELIRDTAGWDRICFQTCIPDTDLIRIVHTESAGSFLDFVQDDGTWANRDEFVDMGQAPSEDTVSGSFGSDEADVTEPDDVVYGEVVTIGRIADTSAPSPVGGATLDGFTAAGDTDELASSTTLEGSVG